MVVFAKILTHKPDVEKSYKMIRNVFYGFRFNGQNYVRNVSAGIYSAFFRSQAVPKIAGLPRKTPKK